MSLAETMPLSSGLVLYQTEDGETRLESRFNGDTIWLATRENNATRQIVRSAKALPKRETVGGSLGMDT